MPIIIIVLEPIAAMTSHVSLSVFLVWTENVESLGQEQRYELADMESGGTVAVCFKLTVRVNSINSYLINNNNRLLNVRHALCMRVLKLGHNDNKHSINTAAALNISHW